MELRETIERLIHIGEMLGQPVGTEAIHYAVVPQGSNVVSLEKYQYPHGTPPERIDENVSLQSTSSFVAYVTAFRDERTRIFADVKKAVFTAWLDYHKPGAPERLKHRAVYQMTYSEAWKEWFRMNGQTMTQEQFADFIEENAGDVLNPDAATMFEVATTLKATTDVNFQSKVSRTSGGVQMTYNEVIDGRAGKTGEMTIPEIFEIRVPVFYGEDPQPIRCRLRYRITGGKLTFLYKMDRPVELAEKAFLVAVDTIKEDLDTDVILGTLPSRV